MSQDSRLDENTTSHVGAIGVTQVMPATGNELDVGDIRKVDSNIHAGVKYIRFLIDRYFTGEPMDDLNKGLFSRRLTGANRNDSQEGLALMDAIPRCTAHGDDHGSGGTVCWGDRGYNAAAIRRGLRTRHIVPLLAVLTDPL